MTDDQIVRIKSANVKETIRLVGAGERAGWCLHMPEIVRLPSLTKVKRSNKKRIEGLSSGRAASGEGL
jgi:hypothetical protein